MADLLLKPEVIQWFTHGAFSRQEIDWPSTSIVHGLMTAEDGCSEDGWTNMSKAIELIRNKWPDLTPKRYGRSSWRHVIHESELFEIRKRTDADTGTGQVWYRRRVPAT